MRILVCHEKHGHRYFDASTEEALYNSALMILKGRLMENHWYSMPEYSPQKLDYTQTDIAKMPASMQSSAQSKLNSYNQCLATYQNDLDEFKMINDAVKHSDGKMAWKLLRLRSGFEYEGVRLEQVQEKY